MIIENQQDVTTAVLSELQRAPDARFKEIMSAFVRHLHEFVREVKLTEEEFHAAIAYVIALGKHSNESHNEAVLMSGSLGLSALICLLNNGDRGTTETDQNMLGPFWRMHSPVTPNGGSIVRSPTPGPAMFVDAWFRDTKGNPIVGAEVDIWHSSPEGFYENQDPVAGRHEPARQVLHRRAGPYQLSQREAGRLSDPDRRADRRSPARAGAAQHAAGASAFPRQQGRLQDADLAALRPGRQVHRHRRAVRRHAPSHRRLHPPRERASRRRPTSRARGIRSSTTSSWKRAAPSCRGRRSPARPAASGRRFRIWRERERSRVPAKRAPIFSGSNAVLPREREPADPGPEQNALVCRLPWVPGLALLARDTRCASVTSRRRPRARPRPRSGRTGSHALPACGCRPYWD